MARYCPNCGTEADDNAVFCPTCGQALDQATETEIPPAPAWPEPETHAPPAPDETAPIEPPPPASAGGWSSSPDAREPDRAARVDDRPPPAAPPPVHATPPAAADSDRPQVNLPITMPLTLSAWLIGGGAALGALGALIGMFDGSLNPIELLLLVALVGVAATVFFSTQVPEIPNLRLATLAIVLVGFGIALDRIGFGSAGVGELLLFLGTAAAAIGAIILELGRDQPLGTAR